MTPAHAVHSEATALPSTASGGKYMCFQLREEVYGLPILEVREIIGVIPIVPVPRAPPAVRGVINLRGKVIPVLDLRLRFGMEPGTITDQSVIIVLHYAMEGQDRTMGLLVDQVLEVVPVEPDQVEPPPAVAADAAAFLRGIAKVQHRVVFLLESSRLVEGAPGAAV